MKKQLRFFLGLFIFHFLLLLLITGIQAQSQYKAFYLLKPPGACTEPPIITCPSDFNSCPGASTDPSNTGNATAKPGGITCNQPIIKYVDIIVSQGPCNGSIHLNRVWTAYDPQDPNLNSSCSQSIKLFDDQAPIISNCPVDITVNVNSNCKANVSWTSPSVTDNCGKLFLTVSHISGDVFPMGVTKVTYTAEDLCNNKSTCSFNINVVGVCCTKPPIINCPVDFIGCPNDTILPKKTGTAIVIPGSPECGTPILTFRDSILSNGPCAGALSLIRIWTAIDPFDSMLASRCMQSIILKDDISPTILNCPTNITVSPGIDCKAQVNWTLPSVSDNCKVVSFVSNFASGSSFSEGTTTITYAATDICGHVSNCSFTITVTGCCQNAPNIICPSLFKACPGTSSDPTITGQAVATKSNVNCSEPLLSYTDSIIPGICPGSMNIFRTWKATDQNNSNLFSTCIQKIELKDDIAPSFTSCPGNITINPDPIDCKAIAQWTPPNGIDNCSSNIVISSSHTPGSSFSVGVTTVTYTITDACGNSAQHVFTVTVPNSCCKQPPSIQCPSNYKGCPIIDCSPVISGKATATPAHPTCGTPIITYKDSLINLYSSCPNGKKFLRIWKAVDPNDSTLATYCRQFIDLYDNTPPIWISCPPNITVNANGACEAIVNWTEPTATDNCSSSIQITSNYKPGQVFPSGTHTVIYTAKDACGNYVNHSFMVTVIGSGLKIKCPSDIIVNKDPNAPGAYVNWSHPTVNVCSPCVDVIPGFIYMGTYGGSKYFCSNKALTWQEAKINCQNVGGKLCVMNTQAENSWVASKLMGQTAFIGLHDSNFEGNFEWIDNSPLNFTNWYPGQPNNANGDQDYVELLPDGTWNDQYSNCVREYICEVPCYEIKQIAGPECGSFFKCGTTKVTYVATQGNYRDTCSFNVTVKCNNNNYCESRGQSCSYMWIQCVNFCNVNNCSGNNGGYAYFPNVCGQLNWGQTYSLCLTPGFSGSSYQVYWKVWIDYNEDGDFVDADEFIAFGTGSSTLCGTFTVPSNCPCPSRNTRMRVSMAYGGYPSNPCCSFAYGEVEDYCINIAPSNVTGPIISRSSNSPVTELFSKTDLNQKIEIKNQKVGGVQIEPINSNIDIFPNPGNQLIQINSSGFLSHQFKVFDSSGKQIYMGNQLTSNNQINVKDWPNGFYLLCIYTPNGERTIKKFVIQH